MTIKNINDMEAQRRELDRQIRAAKRAEKKAANEALLSARQHLGVDLTSAVGADTIEAIARLDQVLMSGQILQQLRRQMSATSSDNDDAAMDVEGGDQHEHHDLVG